MTGRDQWSGRLGEPGREPEFDLVEAMLTRPVEELLAVGGDDRQIPRSGRNAYGFPLSDLRPVVRGSSCTATPPDAIALADAERWRVGLRAAVRYAGALPSADALRAPVAEGILALLGLPDTDAGRVVLTPSGTDAESIVAALAMSATERPLRNILIGANEAGSGTRLSAAGRHFSTRTPFRAPVKVGELLDGFAGDRVSIVDVELRDSRGRARRAFDVEAEVEAHVEDALECGERVLVHAMASSKTDLRQLDPAWVQTWRQRSPEHVRVIVDAAQNRCSAGRIRAFLRAGASVSVTGSKALCAPPFCGALILDDSILHDARTARDSGSCLPAGISDLMSEADLPVGLRPLLPRAQRANLGLLARWTIALREGQRLAALPRLEREHFVNELTVSLTDGLSRLPRIRPIPVAGPTSTIVSFMVLDALGDPLGRSTLTELYRALVASPGVQIGQPVELTPGCAAALRFAIGATTLTRAIVPGDVTASSAHEVADTAVAVLGEALPDFAAV